MNRRSFIRLGGQAAALVPIWAAVPGFANRPGMAPAPQMSEGVRRRIGITTVCFREQFSQTRDKKAAPLPADQALTLLTAPKFIADTLGLHNVEVWSQQFADMSLDYCRDIKAAADAVKSRIINIQVDGQDNLSEPDPAKRAASIEAIKRWMDRAAAVGAPTCRANTGGGPAEAWDVNRTADSFRQLAQYGKTINVKVLVENHTGLSRPIPACIVIIKRVDDPFCRGLSDWGNTPAASTTERVEALKQMFPLIEFVSAKEVDFDEQNRHISYDIVPIIKATEASGYRGIYSIELWGDRHPVNVVAAVKDMMQTVAQNIRG